MARIRDIDKAQDEEQAFLRLKQRAKRHEVKTTKATEAIVESLVEQNKSLSQKLLITRKLLKGAYRLIPSNLRNEFEKLKEELGTFDDLEVHP